MDGVIMGDAVLQVCSLSLETLAKHVNFFALFLKLDDCLTTNPINV